NGSSAASDVYKIHIQSIIDFLIVAFALFLFVKVANTMMKKEEVEEEPEENTILLTEIRDLLQKQNNPLDK
ncbi:hypothetical protein BU038_10790, partial [Staphylococcus simulans]|uniref:MscL family protein n=1 Tax=Staphylococcus simulans TaxID=1286 RepID=UPI000D4C2EC8